ncbi:MAG: efflux transporter outer membrane subunit [Magnetococcales bacterium]|nr:efflux transporter outer membrane subunit [Magnetococcales bacterium]
MGKTARYALPGLMLLLSGCSLVPPLERPEPPVASHWPGAAESGKTDAVGVSWFQLAPDPRLQGLIQTALESNRELRIAVGRVAEARALYGVVGADQLPTLNLGVGQSAARLPADLSGSGKSVINRRLDVNLGVTAFELDFWGRVRSLSEAARASYLATEQAREAFRLSLVADVANAYYTLLEFDERLRLAHDLADNRQRLRDLIQKRRDVGLAGDLDLLTAEGARDAARVQRLDLERNRALAENALNLLVGAPTDQLPPPRRLVDQNLVLDLPIAPPSEVLLNRPDVRAAEQRLIAANANIGAARAAFLPRVGLNLAFGTASRTFSGLFDAGSGAWSFVPNLVQPLFDDGRNQAHFDLAEARKTITVAEYEKSLQQAFREVADLLVARDRLAEQLKAQEALEKSQNQRLALVEARHRAGASHYLEVLDAQREANAATQGVVPLRRALLVTAAQLYKAMGGVD